MSFIKSRDCEVCQEPIHIGDDIVLRALTYRPLDWWGYKAIHLACAGRKTEEKTQ